MVFTYNLSRINFTSVVVKVKRHLITNIFYLIINSQQVYKIIIYFISHKINNSLTPDHL